MRRLTLMAVLTAVAWAAPPDRSVQHETNEPISRSVHIDGIPLERDGDLNHDFRQEVILSADEDVDTSDPKKLADAITDMFNNTDTNADGYLSEDELRLRIEKNTRAHLVKSTQQAVDRMKIADLNEDGFISWDEYLPHFMAQEDDSHKDNKAQRVGRRHDAMRIEDERRSFDKADENNDGKLNSGEWLGFLHPEHSRRGLMQITEEIVKAYDKNKDSFVSREEFIASPPGTVDEQDETFVKMEVDEKKRREHEFDEDIDIDKDGFASVAEIFEYVNPQNTRQAKREVREVMLLADVDKDNQLTLQEMLDRDWLFASSTLLSAGRRLHDEM